MRPLPLLPDRGRPLIFAHRGYSSRAPENTQAAFALARETGVPGLELDVHLCATGELVVAHDDDFRRTGGGDGRPLEELPWEDIRRIDVGSFFDPRFSGERPPLLEEVLEEFCPGMYVDIELKTRKVRGDPLPGRVRDTLRALGERVLRSVTVSSFNPLALRSFKGLCPEVPTGIIWSAGGEVPPLLRRGLGRFLSSADYLKPEHPQAGRFFRFPLALLEGRPLVPWTVDDPALGEGLLRRGAAGLISNKAGELPEGLRGAGALRGALRGVEPPAGGAAEDPAGAAKRPRGGRSGGGAPPFESSGVFP